MKKIVSALVFGLAATMTMAEDQHMVDMADGLNAHQFYQEKNPDSLWSSDLEMPWAKQRAINAYEPAAKAGSIETEVVNSDTAAATEKVHEGGNRYAPGKLVNVRAQFNTKAEQYFGSSGWASQSLYQQMAEICPVGFQRIAEWAEPAEAGSFFLYFQFTCIAPKA